MNKFLIKYNCPDFNCSMPLSESVTIAIGVTESEFIEGVEAPKCEKCGKEMESSLDVRLEEELFFAGIKPPEKT